MAADILMMNTAIGLDWIGSVGRFGGMRVGCNCDL